MTYPLTILLNKTINDIEESALSLAKERSITPDLLAVAMDVATGRIKDKALLMYTDMNIDNINKLDEAMQNKSSTEE